MRQRPTEPWSGHIVDSSMVVIFGRYGLALGTPAKVLILIFIVLFIQQRPRGIVPDPWPRGGGLTCTIANSPISWSF